MNLSDQERAIAAERGVETREDSHGSLSLRKGSAGVEIGRDPNSKHNDGNDILLYYCDDYGDSPARLGIQETSDLIDCLSVANQIVGLRRGDDHG